MTCCNCTMETDRCDTCFRSSISQNVSGFAVTLETTQITSDVVSSISYNCGPNPLYYCGQWTGCNICSLYNGTYFLDRFRYSPFNNGIATYYYEEDISDIPFYSCQFGFTNPKAFIALNISSVGSKNCGSNGNNMHLVFTFTDMAYINCSYSSSRISTPGDIINIPAIIVAYRFPPFKFFDFTSGAENTFILTRQHRFSGRNYPIPEEFIASECLCSFPPTITLVTL